MNIQSPSGPVVRGGFLLFPARCHDSMLTVTDLSKSYGRQTLFDGVSFQVAPGERVGVVGRNGTGKTTLFRILLGEEASDSGTVAVPGGARLLRRRLPPRSRRPFRGLPGAPEPRPYPPFRPRPPVAGRTDQLPGCRLHPVARAIPARLEGSPPADHPRADADERGEEEEGCGDLHRAVPRQGHQGAPRAVAHQGARPPRAAGETVGDPGPRLPVRRGAPHPGGDAGSAGDFLW